MTQAATVALVALAPLIVWRVRARVRRLVGRQQLKPRPAWARAVLIPLVLALLVAAAPDHLLTGACVAGGALIGGLLGVWGIRLTRFENTPEGQFYTPNTMLGLALAAILLSRIGYRLFQVATMPELPDWKHQSFTYSPLTLAILGMLLSYYFSFAIGLLRYQRSAKTGS